jgi:uncharacterized membrane protein YfcA
MPDWLVPAASWLALFAAGLAAGLINVVAGGGSFLTLPVLIFLGLPATLANGTNRVAIVLQNVVAVRGFHRHRVLPWRWALAASVPAVAGAVAGTWAALVIGDEAFEKVLALLMVAISLWTLLAPGRRDPAGAPERSPWSPGLVAAFFAIGVYGGFVQAGVGFLLLAATTWAGLDLVRGNAVKVLAILVFTVVSLAIFGAQGEVDWPAGLVLGAGSVVGGQLGVHLTVLKGHRWVKAVVTAAVIVFAVLLWVT